MKRFKLLFLGLIFLVSCKRTNRILLNGYLKENENIKVFVNQKLVFDKIISKEDKKFNFSKYKDYYYSGNILDYSYSTKRITYRVILKNQNSTIIDTTFYKSFEELPFVIEFDLIEKTNEFTKEGQKIINKSLDKRYVRLFDRNNEEFSYWKMYFQK